MRYSVEIDEANTIRIYDTQNPNENGAPFFLQPHHEDGTPFTDRADAEAWAAAFIAFLEAPAPAREYTDKADIAAYGTASADPE
jgi:hypothetical protein